MIEDQTNGLPRLVPTSHLVEESDPSGVCKLRSRGAPRNTRKNRRGAAKASGASPSYSKASPTSNGVSRSPDADSAAIESGAIQSSCSVRAVHDVISRFDDKKKRLVESIGFGGLLKFPAIKNTSRKLSAWLMRRVKNRDSCLVLPDGTILKFYSEDLHLVFGIPAGGRDISEAGQLEKEAKERVKLQCWPRSGRENQSIKAVEDMVDATYKHPMTPEQEDAFKVAFVVFVMSTLFVPGAKHDHACVDYWGALSIPDKIQEFDWSAYIHKSLLKAASKYKSDIERGSHAPTITGCYLFLQVFYLDNLDIPVWSMDHLVQPRISCFTYSRMRSMIAADTHDRTDTKLTCVYGKTKVRPREQSRYAWAQPVLDRPMDYYTQSASSLWQAVLSLRTLLKLPLQAAGPLYIAVSELNRPSEACRPRSPMECIAIIVKIIEPFCTGFHFNLDMLPDLQGLHPEEGDYSIADVVRRYCAETEQMETNNKWQCRKRPYGFGRCPSDCEDLGCMVIRSLADLGSPDSESSKRSRLTTHSPASDQMPVQSQPKMGEIDYSVIKLMSKFYMVLRFARERNQLDLNAASVEDDQCQIVPQDGILKSHGSSKSPWDLGGSWSYDSHIGAASESANASSDTMPRIVGHHPKYIEVMAVAAQEQRAGLAEIEPDMFDAMLRCFKRSDDKLYAARGRQRWRHYFESDILAAILAGWFDINNPCVRNQFIGQHLTYDVSACSMLFFPVILHERWVCFSWSLKENSIVVFDPACINIPGFSVRSTYKRIAEMLKKALQTAVPILIPAWQHDWTGASVLPFYWRDAGSPCSSRTGVLCAYFCRCFDGQQLRPDIAQVQVEEVAQALFYEVKAFHSQPPTATA